jgi:hypothetical protein
VIILRALLILAAGAASLGQFLQERHRLKVITGLPGRKARDYYEATRTRDERMMIGVTLALVVAAVAAMIVTFASKATGAPPA